MRQTSIVAAIAAVVSVFSFAPFAHAVVVVNESNLGTLSPVRGCNPFSLV